MAFFKFRFPGKSPETATEGLASTPGENVEVLRRRARHRLFGSVVLVFIAVVAFPLIFDSQPRPVAVDMPVVIPDRNSTSPLASGAAVPAVQLPAKPLLPSASSEVPAQASLEPGKEEMVSSAAPAPVTSGRVEDKDAGKADTEAQKAKALLEGASPMAEQARMIVQVGAFVDTDKVREVRRKLEQAGLKTYTQAIDGKDGRRTTRVRVGPFDSRAEADKVAARIRKLDLQASVIVL
ncbi:MAG: SPOR domain-containing protein [Limnohabitans sp.]